MPDKPLDCSIVVPVYNERNAVSATLTEILKALEGDHLAFEIVVVDDGSTDGTAEELRKFAASGANISIVTHDMNQGYGAALKSGIRNASAELIVITDGDGSYPNQDIPKLVRLCEKFDMVVGARTGADVTYSRVRAIPKSFMRLWVSWIARRNVPDINSGLRVFRKSIAEKHFGILPNSFSFTITITLAMLTTYRRVAFEPISYKSRIGSSKIKPIRDTLRFLMIILRTGTYFAPMRIFAPLAFFFLALALISFAIDYFAYKNLTDKTVIIMMLAINTGMFGLLADMIDKRNRQ